TPMAVPIPIPMASHAPRPGLVFVLPMRRARRFIACGRKIERTLLDGRTAAALREPRDTFGPEARRRPFHLMTTDADSAVHAAGARVSGLREHALLVLAGFFFLIAGGLQFL